MPLREYEWMETGRRPPRRRAWPYVAFGVAAIAAAGWCAFWYSAATQAERLVAEWIDRESRLNRFYDCGSRTIEGFPFSIVLRCDQARAQLNNLQPALGLNLSDVQVTAQFYQPTLLTAQFAGPLAIGEPNNAPQMLANWQSARTSVRGTPRAPERISIVLDKPVFERVVDGGRQPLLSGEHIEFVARLVSGTPTDRPLLDVTAKAVATSAPGVHPMAAVPTDAEIDTRLHGLKDFAPKPWPDRFREIQRANGRIEVRNARISQSEWLAIGAGSVGLSPAGKLHGEILVTVAGLDKLMKQLGVEYIARSERVNSAIGALNQLLPGLGDVAREHAGATAAAGLALLGEQVDLEGRKATRLPLRFQDGAVSLGPVPIGQTEALF